MNDEKVIVNRESSKKGYVLTFSDNSQLVIDEETYFKNYIYEKEVLSEELFNDISDKIKNVQCYNKAITYLLNGKKTENRIKSYLESKGFECKAIDNAIYKLKKENKINDNDFINKIIKANMKTGMKRDKLITKLIYHGIDLEIAIKEVDKVIKYEEDTY
ncbi:MAG: RecX family transcriptional regulator [Clostridia bacterium]|jgi:SOS response regulatory protein OraA/RecX